MAKRRNRGDSSDNILGDLSNNEADSPFGGLGENFSASGFADAGYGSSIGHNDAHAKLTRSKDNKVWLADIDAIIPNPTQPRRAIPSSVRQYWLGSSHDLIASFFNKWLEEINIERALNKDGKFPVDDYLNGLITSRTEGIDKEDELNQISDKKIGAKEAALMHIVDLATSIKRDGLINPISIAQNDSRWEIETGERRWLAYQLLNWRFAGDSWEKIPARQVEAVSIWRQSTENNARADLNAIAKARQFALLLMDVRKEKEGDQFQGMDAFEHEQEYYAQVGDGKIYPVPRGTGEKLINAMGIRDVGQLRHLRRLLRLPQIVWTIADDLNWSESFIQKNLLRNSQSDEDVIIQTIKFASAENYDNVSALTPYMYLLEEQVVEKKSKSNKFTYKVFSDGLGEKVHNFIQKMPKKDQQKAIDYLEDMIAALKSE